MDGFLVFDWKRGEVFTVVIILGVILGISSVQLVVGQMKSRDAQRKADVELVGRALQRYYQDYQEYPEATDGGRLVACGKNGVYPCNWGSDDSIVDADNVEYLKGLGRDPLFDKGWRYVYTTETNRQHFKIYISLEYSRDPGIRKNLTVECGTSLQCNWYASD